MYDRNEQVVHLFERGHRKKKIFASMLPIQHPDIVDMIGILECRVYHYHKHDLYLFEFDQNIIDLLMLIAWL